MEGTPTINLKEFDMPGTHPATDKPVRVTAESFADLGELIHDFRVRGKKQVLEILIQFAKTPEGKRQILGSLKN